jgi:hypothetical protein
MRAGRHCTANLNTGTTAVPVWAAMGRISSPKRTQARAANGRTYRAAANKQNVLGVKEYGFSFTYLVKNLDSEDAILAALQDSFDNETVLDIAILDRAAGAGATGIRGPWQVSQLDRSEDDEDAITYDVTIVEVEDDDIGEVDNYTIAGS